MTSPTPDHPPRHHQNNDPLARKPFALLPLELAGYGGGNGEWPISRDRPPGLSFGYAKRARPPPGFYSLDQSGRNRIVFNIAGPRTQQS
jgi:hypothetical protein